MELTLKLTAQAVEDLIRDGLPVAAKAGVRVEAVAPGCARIRLPFHPGMLRPGGVISGPTLFTAADTAMYALVLAHIGPQLMAVTSQLNINFLRKAAPGDVIGDARMLRLGRRTAVIEVLLYAGDDSQPVAQVTGSYALPVAGSSTSS
ncbi:MAG: PaaI family thioesterase [Stenotrophobium sp.]